MRVLLVADENGLIITGKAWSNVHKKYDSFYEYLIIS